MTILNHFEHHDINSVKLPISNNIIYHNRYSTSGDYKNHENNQPIFNNELSLVFNGVLDMGTKKQIENKYNIQNSFLKFKNAKLKSEFIHNIL
mgnify:CR=1 FL=1